MSVLRSSPSVARDFAHVTSWIFDLDNTLYPESLRLFDQIDERMGLFISRLLGCDLVEARRVQKSYFHLYGTTLFGLMREHDVDPQVFLDFVHAIDLACLSQAPPLTARIAALPGRKLVFTNADATYAGRVLEGLGLNDCIEAVHDIRACGLVPKPQMPAYDSLIAALAIDPATALFVEDSARNLVPAKTLGMTTVWLDTGADWGARDIVPEAIDHHITDFSAWLDVVLAGDPQQEGDHLVRNA